MRRRRRRSQSPEFEITFRKNHCCRWLLREPQIVVWLPTHFRLISAKGVRHGSRCSNCRMDDIIGMRHGRISKKINAAKQFNSFLSP